MAANTHESYIWSLDGSVFMLMLPFQAKDELNETDERRASSLKDLRALMKERAADGDDLAKLILERFGDKPDSLFLRFLRARKFDVDRAHELMKGDFQPTKYYFMRSILFHWVERQKREFLLASFWHPSASVIDGEASFVLLVCMNPRPSLRQGGHVFINWELWDSSEWADKAVLCVFKWDGRFASLVSPPRSAGNFCCSGSGLRLKRAVWQ